MKKTSIALVLLLAVMLVAGIACSSLSINNVRVDWDYEGRKYYLSSVTFELENAGFSRVYYNSVKIYANDELVGSEDVLLSSVFDPGNTHTFEFIRCTTDLECLHEYSAYSQELVELKIIISDDSDTITTYTDTIKPTQ